MQTEISRIRPLLATGQTTWMVNPGGASVDVVDMLAKLGAKCLFIDCERTAVGIESVTALARCAQSHDMATLVRTESMQPEILVRYLDRGIDGIVVPHVETVAQLKSIGEVVAYVNKGKLAQTFSIAQIESQAAVENIAALAADRSVDGFLIGPNDLSHSMGFVGDTSRPELAQAIDGVVTSLQQHGRTWGIPGVPESAQRWSQRGAQLLYCTLEQILQRGFGDFASGTARS
jgi:4-hydroxy-2-oxoheptanedioate aldolase